VGIDVRTTWKENMNCRQYVQFKLIAQTYAIFSLLHFFLLNKIRYDKAYRYCCSLVATSVQLLYCLVLTVRLPEELKLDTARYWKGGGQPTVMLLNCISQPSRSRTVTLTSRCVVRKKMSTQKVNKLRYNKV